MSELEGKVQRARGRVEKGGQGNAGDWVGQSEVWSFLSVTHFLICFSVNFNEIFTHHKMYFESMEFNGF